MKPCLLVGLFLAILSLGSLCAGELYPAQDGPLGYGLFQRLGPDDMKQGNTPHIDNPVVAGAAYYLGWARLEPKEGEYKWDILEKLIQPWQEKGKRVIFRIDVISKRPQPDLPSGTPDWVFASGAKKLMATSNGENAPSAWPVYWDEKFLEKFSNFVKAFAKRFDGHPGIEFVFVGFGEFSTVKVCGPSSKVMDQYNKAGYTQEKWLGTVRKAIDLYRTSFTKTPVCITLSPIYKAGDQSDKDVAALAKEVAAKGVYVFNHRLDASGESGARAHYPDLYHEIKDQTKTVLGPDDPVTTGWGRGGPSGHPRDLGKLEDMLAIAFGGVKGIPETGVDYFVFYIEDIAAATKGTQTYDPHVEEIFRKAVDRLKTNHGKT